MAKDKFFHLPGVVLVGKGEKDGREAIVVGVENEEAGNVIVHNVSPFTVEIGKHISSEFCGLPTVVRVTGRYYGAACRITHQTQVPSGFPSISALEDAIRKLRSDNAIRKLRSDN